MPTTTLILNIGSSSLKAAVAVGRRIVVRLTIDRFGRQAQIRIKTEQGAEQFTATIRDVRQALTILRGCLRVWHITPTRIAHRIVHGGQKYTGPTRLTPPVLRYLRTLVSIAPLHQPANLDGVAFSRRTWPRATHWGVFDTALYRALPAAVRTYALPHALTDRLHIEKYGFHGLSHTWAFSRAARALGRTARQTSAVTVHLGSGASMTLWADGRPRDTTMGFSPLEGLVMSTRSGDIDPAIPLYLQEHLGWTPRRVKDLLEHRAGLVGLSGLSDMRDLLVAAGHPVAGWPKRRWATAVRARARLALDVYCYHVRRALSAYLGLLPPTAAIVFTGPVGENRTIQRLVLADLPVARGRRRLTVHADEEQALFDQLP